MKKLWLICLMVFSVHECYAQENHTVLSRTIAAISDHKRLAFGALGFFQGALAGLEYSGSCISKHIRRNINNSTISVSYDFHFSHDWLPIIVSASLGSYARIMAYERKGKKTRPGLLESVATVNTQVGFYTFAAQGINAGLSALGVTEYAGNTHRAIGLAARLYGAAVAYKNLNAE